MHTVDNLASGSASRWARLRRDVRVGWRIVRMLAAYVIRGGRHRRAVRRCAARGRLFYVDDHMTRR